MSKLVVRKLLLVLMCLGGFVLFTAQEYEMAGGGGCSCSGDSEVAPLPDPLIPPPNFPPLPNPIGPIPPFTPTACDATNDCPSGTVCTNLSCNPGLEPCHSTTDCDVLQICHNDTCIPTGGACLQHGDCGTGMYCEDGNCIAGVADCHDDSACGENADCVNETCAPIETCTKTSECFDTETCQSGVCVPGVTGCSEQKTCPAGQLCDVNGTCVDVPPPPDNDAPIFLFPAPDETVTFTAGTAQTIAILAIDPDGEALTYEMSGPAGSQLAPTADGAEFAWTPAETDVAASPHVVTFTAIDPAGNLAEVSIIIIVEQAPEAVGDGVAGTTVGFQPNLGAWSQQADDDGDGYYSGWLFGLKNYGSGSLNASVWPTGPQTTITTTNLQTVSTPSQVKLILQGDYSALTKKTSYYQDGNQITAFAIVTDAQGRPLPSSYDGTVHFSVLIDQAGVLVPLAGKEAIPAQSSIPGLFYATMAIPPDTFAGDADRLGAVRVAVSTEAGNIIEQAPLRLVQVPAPLTLAPGEMGLQLPIGPRFTGYEQILVNPPPSKIAGETFVVELYANTQEKVGGAAEVLSGFQVTIVYDDSALELQKNTTGFPAIQVHNWPQSWIPDATTVNDKVAGTLTFSATHGLPQASTPQGTKIKLATIPFRVKGIPAAGNYAIGGTKITLNKLGVKPIGATNVALKLADGSGDAAPGQVVVRATVPRAIHVVPNTHHLWDGNDLVDLLPLTLPETLLFSTVGIQNRPSNPTTLSKDPKTTIQCDAACQAIFSGAKVFQAAGSGTAGFVVEHQGLSSLPLMISASRVEAKDLALTVNDVDQVTLHRWSVSLKDKGPTQHERAQAKLLWTVPNVSVPTTDGGTAPLQVDLTQLVTWVSSKPDSIAVDANGVVSYLSGTPAPGKSTTISVDGVGLPGVTVSVADTMVDINQFEVLIPAYIELQTTAAGFATDPYPVPVDSGVARAFARVTNQIPGIKQTAPVQIWATSSSGKRFQVTDFVDSGDVTLVSDNPGTASIAAKDPAQPGAQLAQLIAEGAGTANITATLGGINLSGTGTVKVDVPDVDQIELLVANDHLAINAEDPAAKVLKLPTETTYHVLVHFADGSTWDATLDPKTACVVEGNAKLVQIQPGTIKATNLLTGMTTLSCTVPGLPGAAGAGTKDIWVMSLSGVTIGVWEDFDTSAFNDLALFAPAVDAAPVADTTFTKIEGSAQWQQGRVTVQGQWTDPEYPVSDLLPHAIAIGLKITTNPNPVYQIVPNGAVAQLVPKAAGTNPLIVACPKTGPGNSVEIASNSIDITVLDEAIDVTTLHVRGTGVSDTTDSNGPAPDDAIHDSLLGSKDVHKTKLRVIGAMADGTRVVLQSASATLIPNFLNFGVDNLTYPNDSGNPPLAAKGAVLSDPIGILTITGNGGVTVQSTIGALNAGAAAPTTAYRLATNLEPAVGDADIGRGDGRFFRILQTGQAVTVPIRVNVGMEKLGSFKVEFVWDPESVLTVSSVTSANTPNGLNPDYTGSEEHRLFLVGSFAKGKEPTGIVTIGTATLMPNKDTEKLSTLTGTIYELKNSAGKNIGAAQKPDDAFVPQPIVAGAGVIDPDADPLDPAAWNYDQDANGELSSFDCGVLQGDLNDTVTFPPPFTYEGTPLADQASRGDYWRDGQLVLGDVTYCLQGMSQTFYLGKIGLQAGAGAGVYKISAQLTQIKKAQNEAKKLECPEASKTKVVADVVCKNNPEATKSYDLPYDATNALGECFFHAPLALLQYNDDQLDQGEGCKVTISGTALSDAGTVKNNFTLPSKIVPVLGTDGASPCAGVQCPIGTSCAVDATTKTAACVDKCAGVTCEAGFSCEPATGACVEELIDKCDGVFCPNGTCDPTDGVCKTKCTGLVCGEGQQCDEGSGACAESCALPKDCAADQLCGDAGLCEDCPAGGCACATNSECGAGGTCTFGKCEGGADCSADPGVCGDVALCVDGTCQNGGTCSTTSECAGEQICVEGSCVGGTSCIDSTDCENNQVCVKADGAATGSCQGGEPCALPAECGADEACTENGCLPIGTNLPPQLVQPLEFPNYEVGQTPFFSFVGKITDPDGDDLIFTLLPVPTLTLQPKPTSNGEYEWGPLTAGELGAHTFTLEVVDVAADGTPKDKSSFPVTLTVVPEGGTSEGDAVEGATLEFQVLPTALGHPATLPWLPSQSPVAGTYQEHIIGVASAGSGIVTAAVKDATAPPASLTPKSWQAPWIVRGTPAEATLTLSRDEVYALEPLAAGGDRVNAFVFITDALGRPVTPEKVEFLIDGTSQGIAQAKHVGLYRQQLTVTKTSALSARVTDSKIAAGTINTPAQTVTFVAPPAGLTLGTQQMGMQLPYRFLLPGDVFTVPVYADTGDIDIESFTMNLSVEAPLHITGIAKAAATKSFLDFKPTINPAGTTATLTSGVDIGGVPIKGAQQEIARVSVVVDTTPTLSKVSYPTVQGTATLYDVAGPDFTNAIQIADFSGSTTTLGKLRIRPAALRGLAAWASDPYLIDLSLVGLPTDSGTLATYGLWNTGTTPDEGIIVVSDADWGVGITAGADVVQFTSGKTYQAKTTGHAILKVNVENLSVSDIHITAKQLTEGDIQIGASDTTLDFISGAGTLVRQTARIYAYTDFGGSTERIGLSQAPLLQFSVPAPLNNNNGLLTVSADAPAATLDVGLTLSNPPAADTIIQTLPIEVTDLPLTQSFDTLSITIPAKVEMQPTVPILLSDDPDDPTFGTGAASAKVTNYLKYYNQEVPLTFWASFANDHGQAVWTDISPFIKNASIHIHDHDGDDTGTTVAFVAGSQKRIVAKADSGDTPVHISAEFFDQVIEKQPVWVDIPVPKLDIIGCDTSIALSASDAAAKLKQLPVSTTISIKTKDGVAVPIKKLSGAPSDLATLQGNLVNGTMTISASGTDIRTKMQLGLDVGGFLGLGTQPCTISIVSLADIQPQVWEDFDADGAPGFAKFPDVAKPKNNTLQLIENTAAPQGFQRARLTVQGTYSDSSTQYFSLADLQQIGLDPDFSAPGKILPLIDLPANATSGWPVSMEIIPLQAGLLTMFFHAEPPASFTELNFPLVLTITTDRTDITQLTPRGHTADPKKGIFTFIDNQPTAGDKTGQQFAATFAGRFLVTTPLRVIGTMADGTHYDLINKSGDFLVPGLLSLDTEEILLPKLAADAALAPQPKSISVVGTSGQLRISRNGAVTVAVGLGAAMDQGAAYVPPTTPYTLAANLVPIANNTDVDLGATTGRFVKILGQGPTKLPVRIHLAKTQQSLNGYEVHLYFDKRFAHVEKPAAGSGGVFTDTSGLPPGSPAVAVDFEAKDDGDATIYLADQPNSTAHIALISKSPPYTKDGVAYLGDIPLTIDKTGPGYSWIGGHYTVNITNADGSITKGTATPILAGKGWIDPAKVLDFDEAAPFDINDIIDLQLYHQAHGNLWCVGAAVDPKCALGNYNQDEQVTPDDMVLGVYILQKDFAFVDAVLAGANGQQQIQVDMVDRDGIPLSTKTAVEFTILDGDVAFVGTDPGTTTDTISLPAPNAAGNIYAAPFAPYEYNGPVTVRMSVDIEDNLGHRITDIEKTFTLTGSKNQDPPCAANGTCGSELQACLCPAGAANCADPDKTCQVVECTDDAQCNVLAGESCDVATHTCGKPADPCAGKTCGTGESCDAVTGACEANACITKSDCGDQALLECQNGECALPDDTCYLNADCEPLDVCVEGAADTEGGICKGGEGGVCNTNDDCAGGANCVDTPDGKQCQMPPPSCQPPATCEAGLTCTGEPDWQCLPDQDDDGVPDETDNCQTSENPNQEDGDLDGLGDACDPSVDLGEYGVTGAQLTVSTQPGLWDGEISDVGAGKYDTHLQALTSANVIPAQVQVTAEGQTTATQALTITPGNPALIYLATNQAIAHDAKIVGTHVVRPEDAQVMAYALVTDARGNRIIGQEVQFSSGLLGNATATTDAQGIAKTTFTASNFTGAEQTGKIEAITTNSAQGIKIKSNAVNVSLAAQPTAYVPGVGHVWLELPRGTLTTGATFIAPVYAQMAHALEAIDVQITFDNAHLAVNGAPIPGPGFEQLIATPKDVANTNGSVSFVGIKNAQSGTILIGQIPFQVTTTVETTELAFGGGVNNLEDDQGSVAATFQVVGGDLLAAATSGNLSVADKTLRGAFLQPTHVTLFDLSFLMGDAGHKTLTMPAWALYNDTAGPVALSADQLSDTTTLRSLKPEVVGAAKLDYNSQTTPGISTISLAVDNQPMSNTVTINNLAVVSLGIDPQDETLNKLPAFDTTQESRLAIKARFTDGETTIYVDDLTQPIPASAAIVTPSIDFSAFNADANCVSVDTVTSGGATSYVARVKDTSASCNEDVYFTTTSGKQIDQSMHYSTSGVFGVGGKLQLVIPAQVIVPPLGAIPALDNDKAYEVPVSAHVGAIFTGAPETSIKSRVLVPLDDGTNLDITDVAGLTLASTAPGVVTADSTTKLITAKGSGTAEVTADLTVKGTAYHGTQPVQVQFANPKGLEVWYQDYDLATQTANGGWQKASAQVPLELALNGDDTTAKILGIPTAYQFKLVANQSGGICVDATTGALAVGCLDVTAQGTSSTTSTANKANVQFDPEKPLGLISAISDSSGGSDALVNDEPWVVKSTYWPDLSASVNINIVGLEKFELKSFETYTPDGDRRVATTLALIEGSGQYQRANLDAILSFSNGKTITDEEQPIIGFSTNAGQANATTIVLEMWGMAGGPASIELKQEPITLRGDLLVPTQSGLANIRGTLGTLTSNIHSIGVSSTPLQNVAVAIDWAASCQATKQAWSFNGNCSTADAAILPTLNTVAESAHPLTIYAIYNDFKQTRGLLATQGKVASLFTDILQMQVGDSTTMGGSATNPAFAAQKLSNYASPDALVANGVHGVVQAHRNGFSTIALQLADDADDSGALTQNLFINLAPKPYDIDLGQEYGHHYARTAPTIIIPVRVHPGTQAVQAIDLNVQFDSSIVKTDDTLCAASLSWAPGLPADAQGLLGCSYFAPNSSNNDSPFGLLKLSASLKKPISGKITEVFRFGLDAIATDAATKAMQWSPMIVHYSLSGVTGTKLKDAAGVTLQDIESAASRGDIDPVGFGNVIHDIAGETETVDSGDVVSLLNTLVNPQSLDAVNADVAKLQLVDIFTDGKLDVLDALYLHQMGLGLSHFVTPNMFMPKIPAEPFVLYPFDGSKEQMYVATKLWTGAFDDNGKQITANADGLTAVFFEFGSLEAKTWHYAKTPFQPALEIVPTANGAKVQAVHLGDGTYGLAVKGMKKNEANIPIVVIVEIYNPGTPPTLKQRTAYLRTPVVKGSEFKPMLGASVSITPEKPSCTKTSECLEDETICDPDKKICVPSGGSDCITNTECQDGFSCVSNNCEPKSTVCDDDGDCTNGVCGSNEVCTDYNVGTEGEACGPDKDPCAAGTTCLTAEGAADGVCKLYSDACAAPLVWNYNTGTCESFYCPSELDINGDGTPDGNLWDPAHPELNYDLLQPGVPFAERRTFFVAPPGSSQPSADPENTKAGSFEQPFDKLYDALRTIEKRQATECAPGIFSPNLIYIGCLNNVKATCTSEVSGCVAIAKGLSCADDDSACLHTKEQITMECAQKELICRDDAQETCRENFLAASSLCPKQPYHVVVMQGAYLATQVASLTANTRVWGGFKVKHFQKNGVKYQCLRRYVQYQDEAQDDFGASQTADGAPIEYCYDEGSFSYYPCNTDPCTYNDCTVAAPPETVLQVGTGGRVGDTGGTARTTDTLPTSTPPKPEDYTTRLSHAMCQGVIDAVGKDLPAPITPSARIDGFEIGIRAKNNSVSSCHAMSISDASPTIAHNRIVGLYADSTPATLPDGVTAIIIKGSSSPVIVDNDIVGNLHQNNTTNSSRAIHLYAADSTPQTVTIRDNRLHPGTLSSGVSYGIHAATISCDPRSLDIRGNTISAEFSATKTKGIVVNHRCDGFAGIFTTQIEDLFALSSLAGLPEQYAPGDTAQGATITDCVDQLNAAWQIGAECPLQVNPAVWPTKAPAGLEGLEHCIAKECTMPAFWWAHRSPSIIIDRNTVLARDLDTTDFVGIEWIDGGAPGVTNRLITNNAISAYNLDHCSGIRLVEGAPALLNNTVDTRCADQTSRAIDSELEFIPFNIYGITPATAALPYMKNNILGDTYCSVGVTTAKVLGTSNVGHNIFTKMPDGAPYTCIPPAFYMGSKFLDQTTDYNGLFKDWDEQDYHLRSTGAALKYAINTGQPITPYDSVLGLPVRDRDGVERPVGCDYDLGAYEGVLTSTNCDSFPDLIDSGSPEGGTDVPDCTTPDCGIGPEVPTIPEGPGPEPLPSGSGASSWLPQIDEMQRAANEGTTLPADQALQEFQRTLTEKLETTHGQLDGSARTLITDFATKRLQQQLARVLEATTAAPEALAQLQNTADQLARDGAQTVLEASEALARLPQQLEASIGAEPLLSTDEQTQLRTALETKIQQELPRLVTEQITQVAATSNTLLVESAETVLTDTTDAAAAATTPAAAVSAPAVNGAATARTGTASPAPARAIAPTDAPAIAPTIGTAAGAAVTTATTPQATALRTKTTAQATTQAETLIRQSVQQLPKLSPDLAQSVQQRLTQQAGTALSTVPTAAPSPASSTTPTAPTRVIKR